MEEKFSSIENAMSDTISNPNASHWNALRKIVKRLPANLAYYGSALGAIVLAGGGELPPGLEFVAGSIGGNMLSNMISDILKDEDLLDDEIRRRAEDAIRKSDIANLLTKQDFLQGYARLIQRLDAQKNISQDILDELQTGFSKVATADQVEELKHLILALPNTIQAISKKPSVFISYRRVDGGEFAKRLHDDLENADVNAWLDVRDMPSGDTFISHIDVAIARADYFLLVATPEAINSENCRDEWKKALEKYKPIIPLMLMGEYKDLPQEAFIYLNDARDFRDEARYTAELAQLIKQISILPSHPGKVRGVPKLPSYYLPRTELLSSLRQKLTAHKTTVLTSPNPKVGVHGMGGVGKSILGMALANDYFVRRTFKDGILWLSVGSEPKLPKLWSTLAEYLDDETQSFTEAEWEKARDFFEKKTQDKEYLVILDNVWDSDHVKAFSRLGEQSRLFVTSRHANILVEIDADLHPVDVLSDTSARDLLANAAHVKPEDLPSPAEEIIHSCGKLPLALAMIGARVRNNKNDIHRWEDALESLKTANLEEITARFLEYPEYLNLFAALKVSMDALGEEIEHYYDFSIFPEDVAIPETTLLTFWKPLEGRKVRRILDKLVDHNLLIRTDSGSLTIHDLQQLYIRREAKDIDARHQRLLNQYNFRRWAELPQAEPYIYDFLVYHLLNAKYFEEAFALFNTSEWMARRFSQSEFTYDGYIADLELVSKVLVNAQTSEQTIKKLFRLALIRTSINSLNTNYSPELLAKLLESQHWSTKRCIKVLSGNANHKLRALGSAKLLEIGGIEESDAIRLEKIGLRAIASDEYPGEQIKLLKEFAPHLKYYRRESLLMWLEAARKISSNFYRAEALFPLAGLIEDDETEIIQQVQQVIESLAPGYWDFIYLYNVIEAKRVDDPDAFVLLQQIADSIPEQSLEHPIASHLNMARAKMMGRMMGIDAEDMFGGLFKQFDRLLMGDNAQQQQLAKDAAHFDTTSPNEVEKFFDSMLSIADEGIQVQVLAALLKWVDSEQFSTLLYKVRSILEKGSNKLNNIEYSFDLQAKLLLGQARIMQYTDKVERDNFIATLVEGMRESNYLLFRGNIFDELADLCDRTQIEEALKVLLEPPSSDIPIFWTDAISKLLRRLEALTSDYSYGQHIIERVEKIIHNPDARVGNLNRLPLLRYYPSEQRDNIVAQVLKSYLFSAPNIVELMDEVVKETNAFQVAVSQLLLQVNHNNLALLPYFVRLLNENQLRQLTDTVKSAQNSDAGVANLQLLANLLDRSPENQDIRRLAQMQLSNILFVVAGANIERENLLSILSIEHILEPVLLDQETLQDIATQIIEICNEWEWM